MQIANNQGIPIYTVNQSNINAILPQLQVDSDTINDIINAVNAGKEVTVSKTNIDFNGWTGCGFIVFDPDTGGGVYMISGGLNGMWLVLHWLILSTLFVLAVLGALAIIGLLVYAIALLLPIIISVIETVSILISAEMLLFVYGSMSLFKNLYYRFAIYTPQIMEAIYGLVPGVPERWGYFTFLFDWGWEKLTADN